MFYLMLSLSCVQEQDPVTVEVEVVNPESDTDTQGEITTDDTGISSNTAPSPPEVHIMPQEVSPGSGMSCSVRTASEDPDEGDPLAYDYAWALDGEVYPLTVGEVEGGITESGQYWTCYMRAFDGVEWSEPGSYTVFVDGCDVGSLAFTGEDYVEAVGSENLELSDVFTVEAYTKLDAEAIDEKVVIVSQVSGSTGWWFGTRRTSNGGFKTEFVTLENGLETRYVGAQLPASIWRHVAVSSDGDTLRIFRNGEMIAEETWLGMPSVSGPVLVGTLFRPGENGLPPDEDGGWQGLLDQVHISDDALYTETVEPELQIRPEDSSVLFFDFNEGYGDMTFDFSGSGFDGILFGPTWTNDSPCSSPD